jgi:hypothetical protein
VEIVVIGNPFLAKNETSVHRFILIVSNISLSPQVPSASSLGVFYIIHNHHAQKGEHTMIWITVLILIAGAALTQIGALSALVVVMAV